MDQAVFSYKLMLLPLLACSKYLKWQISNICNISRKRWGINTIFWVKLNIKVFYKLILGMMHIWHTGKLSKFQYPLPPCSYTSKNFPPLWPWTSNYKRNPHSLQQTMEQHCACERTESKQKKKVTSHSNWSRVLSFDLAHKQSNGNIKKWLHCLSSESKGKFLVSNILMFDTACLQKVCKTFTVFQERSEGWSWFIAQMSITVIVLSHCW